MANVVPVRANSLRLTRTDFCGVPVAEATANSRLTTGGFIQVGVEFETDESQTINVKGADGATCIYNKGQSTLLGANITIQLCNFNQFALEMFIGSALLVDGTDDVGAVLSASGQVSGNNLAVEWFSNNNNNDACAGGTQRPFIHFVAPRTNRWVISGNTDFGDLATTITLTGYAEPTTSFAAVRAADAWSAADLTAINNDGLLAWREITAAQAPTNTAVGYDV